FGEIPGWSRRIPPASNPRPQLRHRQTVHARARRLVPLRMKRCLSRIQVGDQTVQALKRLRVGKPAGHFVQMGNPLVDLDALVTHGPNRISAGKSARALAVASLSPVAIKCGGGIVVPAGWSAWRLQ